MSKFWATCVCLALFMVIRHAHCSTTYDVAMTVLNLVTLWFWVDSVIEELDL